ncbi:hypothetical protein RF679_00395 [Undibacterium cyanobacteriorum]|uniref:Cytochrome n=1 Tax=Undibacterium cyanobacteriorum TaxID=3073561 RepID=A0ABY9RHQ2_9BURK|nr:hypothetical protein [Undibacterium sp. 20NA77.5]WMW80753.1 hypothetical protein RF679_00395 [Undibacterium sp. 20NA77.5]
MSYPHLLQLPYHSNPYPIYVELRERGELWWDDRHQPWLATTSDSVAAILSSLDCVVRPPHELVPKAIANGAAGQIFGKLMRMNEGEAHRLAKASLQQALRQITPDRLQTIMQAQNGFIDLLDGPQHQSHQLDPERLNRWIFAVPVRTMAMALGFDHAQSAVIEQEIADFVACLSPLSHEMALQRAHQAALHLQQRLAQMFQEQSGEEGSFAHAYQLAIDEHGWQDASAWIANLLGILSQTYEASAGLLGNCIVGCIAHLRTQGLHRDFPLESDVQRYVQQIAQQDPAIHNTRRFVVRDWEIAGQTLKAGQTILLLLASANHSEAEAQMSFSHARHRCPGEALALSIASSALTLLLQAYSSDALRDLQFQYRPSMNARMPTFSHLNDASK